MDWNKSHVEVPKRGSEIILYSRIWNTLTIATYNCRSKDKKTLFVDAKLDNGYNEWEVYAPDYYWAYSSEFNFPKEE